jgi:hypothetical protein
MRRASLLHAQLDAATVTLPAVTAISHRALSKLLSAAARIGIHFNNPSAQTDAIALLSVGGQQKSS